MKYCKSCHEPMVESREDGHIVYRCYGQDCATWQAFEFECANHKPENRRFYRANGVLTIRAQCPTCYDWTAVSKSSITQDIESLPLFNEKGREIVSAIFINKRFDLNKQKQQKQKDEFFRQHDLYLKSDLWRAKREKVLTRDRRLCQACLENQATQVHHLSYKNWQDEPLFELVSICEPCHNKIHQK